MSDNAIAIIPARGGSKRIPRKNVIDFMGMPMIGHTIKAAQESERFKRIVVSTDCPEIADVSRDLGAEVPFLRQDHADDFAPVSEASLSSVEQARQHFGEDYDTVVQLMANCPLRTAADIRDVLDVYHQSPAPSVISAFKYGFMNPAWAVTLDQNGHPTHLYDVETNSRSQESPTLYCASGAIWVCSWDHLADEKTFFGTDHIYHPIPWQNAVDIDDEDDLLLAKALYLVARQS